MTDRPSWAERIVPPMKMAALLVAVVAAAVDLASARI
jgi:hypothetical protein